ncbi:MAG: ABC transporter permease [Anaerolineae bacterium]
MIEILHGLEAALSLLLSGDPELRQIIGTSLRVSGLALVISSLLGVPAGAALGFAGFPGRRVIVALLYTGMGTPPVVIGLLVYLAFSRSGPFGELRWLFTPAAMTVAQTLIAFPYVASLTMTAIQSVDHSLRLQLRALGATARQEATTILLEARAGVAMGIITAFGRIISEVGAVMLVGGNIAHKTRVLTTAIVLHTRQGEFGLAIALGIILLVIAFVINLVLLMLQGRERAAAPSSMAALWGSSGARGDRSEAS